MAHPGEHHPAFEEYCECIFELQEDDVIVIQARIDGLRDILALSLDDFIITFFNAGSLVTFPLQIFGASRVAIPAQINVLATMLLMGSITIMVGGLIIESRRNRLNNGSDAKG